MLKAKCSGCGDDVIAKCGEIKIWHWAHVNKECDSWYEPESAWHIGWKSLAPPDNQEVVIGPHRADIRTSKGTVIELQHSPISPEEIREREQFYGDMIWIFDASAFSVRMDMEKVFRCVHCGISGTDRKALGRRLVHKTGCSAKLCDPNPDIRSHEMRFVDFKAVVEDVARKAFSWKHMKTSLLAVTKPLYFDVGVGPIPSLPIHIRQVFNLSEDGTGSFLLHNRKRFIKEVVCI